MINPLFALTPNVFVGTLLLGITILLNVPLV